MRNPGDFLVDQPGPIPWQLPEGGRGSFEAGDLFLGKGTNPLEVAPAPDIAGNGAGFPTREPGLHQLSRKSRTPIGGGGPLCLSLTRTLPSPSSNTIPTPDGTPGQMGQTMQVSSTVIPHFET
jgi:hypothetical protein